jgi:hypothetical protein
MEKGGPRPGGTCYLAKETDGYTKLLYRLREANETTMGKVGAEDGIKAQLHPTLSRMC